MRWDEKTLEKWAKDLLEGYPDMHGTPPTTEAQEEDGFTLWAQLGRMEYEHVVRARLRRLKHGSELPPEAGSRLERVWRKYMECCTKLFRNAAPGREEVMDEHPGIADVFSPISEKLDNETLRDLNAAVTVDGESEEDVARRFLRENGAL